MKNITFKSFVDERTFWKRFGLILTIVSCFVFFGCKDLLSVPTVTPGSKEEIPAERVIATPMNVSASHGQKKKITIHWTPVNNASYYFIYKADTPHDTYVQIDEAPGTAASKAIDVPAGYSGYFKVAAVNAYGQLSDMSLTTYGTSLATPVITAIEQQETSASVYWYMENLNAKSYLNTVRFAVNCYNPDGTIKEQKQLTSTLDTFCTFDNLNSGTEYNFEIETFILSDQSSTEKSLKLSAKTAVSTIPQSAYFAATEGTQESTVTLSITLPQIAKILVSKGTGGTNNTEYEDRAVYFKIQRFNDSTNAFDTIVDYLSFKGSTTEIGKDDAVFNDYQEGDIINWTDTNVERGVKYQYRVITYVDNYYKGDTSVREISCSDPEKAYVKTGWAAAIPSLGSTQITYTEKNYDPDDETAVYKKSAQITHTASWNTLGKDADYVYLLLEKHRKLKSDNGNEIDTTGTEQFVSNPSSNLYFTSISEISTFTQKYNFYEPDVDEDGTIINLNPESNAEIRGYYNYTLYIIPKTVADKYPDPNSSISELKSQSLTKVEDSSTKLITNNEGLVTPVITVSDGYKNKAVIEFEAKASTNYKITRHIVLSTGEIDSESTTVELKSGTSGYTVSGTNVKYVDSSLESGTAYQYTVYASNADFDDVPSNTLTAYTLGTPSLTFDSSSTDYSTVTVKWNSVLHDALEREIQNGTRTSPAITYNITHNDKTYTFAQDEFNPTAESDIIEKEDTDGIWKVTCIRGKEFTLTLKKDIYGFDYSDSKPKIAAVTAGKDSSLTITASNFATDAENSNTTTATVAVRTLGPAETDLTVSQAEQPDYINVSWKKIEGVSLYAVRRICNTQIIDDIEDDKTDLIYVSANGTVSVNSEAIPETRTQVYSDTSRFYLVDHQCTASDAQNAYQSNQAKIAWGLKYTYTVTPVKTADDQPFTTEDEESSTGIILTNDNNSNITKTGFATGYGINIKASKADYADHIHVTWTNPNNYAYNTPSISYKAEGGSWTEAEPISKENDGSADVYLPEGIRTKRVEFAVTYYSTKNPNWAESYLSYLSSTLEADADKEQQNMGYQFTLPLFTAEQPTGTGKFEEVVKWQPWTAATDNRKKCPGDGINGNCYEVYVKNLNVSANWYKVAEVSKAGEITLCTLPTWAATTVKAIPNGLSLTPDGLTDTTGYNDGLLKVQRDYKHYYKIVAKRNGSAGEVVTTIGDFDDTTTKDVVAKTPVSTYRKISAEEFAKCVTLVLADGLHKKGGAEGTLDSKYCKGTLKTDIPYAWTVPASYDYKFETKNFQTIFAKTPGSDSSLTSFLTLSSSMTSGGCTYSNKVYCFEESSITVTSDVNLPSYKGSVSIKVGSDERNTVYSATIKYKNASNAEKPQSISKNQTEFKEWFPFALGSDLGSSDTDGSNSSFPTMDTSSIWWEVRN